MARGGCVFVAPAPFRRAGIACPRHAGAGAFVPAHLSTPELGSLARGTSPKTFSISRQNSGRSSGLRAVTRLPSQLTVLSSHVAPA